MTTPDRAALKEQVRQDWTHNAAAWHKWNQKFVLQTAAATELVVSSAALGPGMRVLDLASGTGEPALSLAAAVAPGGSVLATDLVPDMLTRIEETARARGLELRAETADMEALPYDDASFDRVTSRFGIMFPPDTPRALAEIRRVLKPGGRVTFVVWGPPTQPLHAMWLGPYMRRVQLPPPPPDTPSPFRFAAPGSLSARMVEAGFGLVEETAQSIPWNWPGPPEEALQMQREIVPQLLKRFEAAMSPEEREATNTEVLANMTRAYDGRAVNLEALVYVVTAVR